MHLTLRRLNHRFFSLGCPTHKHNRHAGEHEGRQQLIELEHAPGQQLPAHGNHRTHDNTGDSALIGGFLPGKCQEQRRTAGCRQPRPCV